MKQESLKSAQQHHNQHHKTDHQANLVAQHQGMSHLHHPSVQNDLKLGLSGMGGHLGMMGQLDNKTNQDILKAVSKVTS